MTHEEFDRLGIAAAFKRAKKVLARHLTDMDRELPFYQYICIALDYEPARDIIRKRLQGSEVLEDWLRWKGVPQKDLTFERVQAHRHAWIDLLIEEFSQPAAPLAA